jgi:hypothetical protein
MPAMNRGDSARIGSQLGDKSMSKKAAEEHKKASDHHEQAAKHHKEAAKHHDSGNHEKAAHHAQAAHGHQVKACECGDMASKHHMEEHGGK